MTAITTTTTTIDLTALEGRVDIYYTVGSITDLEGPSLLAHRFPQHNAVLLA